MKLGTYKSLLIGAITAALTNLLFALLAIIDKNLHPYFKINNSFDGLSVNLSSVISFTFPSTLKDKMDNLLWGLKLPNSIGF